MSDLTSPEEVLRQLMHDSLAQYAIAMHPSYEVAPHIQLIIDKLEAVERGEVDRLMIFEPPQHGKTQVASKLFPAWYLGRNPKGAIISAAYGQTYAKSFGRAVRNYINTPLHQAVFPTCRISDDSAAADVFNTTEGGEYIAVGRGGPTTGHGANIILIDDPIKDRREAGSPAIRDQLKEWYTDVVYTRERAKSAIICINTRWHVDDLTGWLLREHSDEKWEVICLPAIAEENDPLGRRVGEALWPSHFPLEKLERKRKHMPTSSWVSLYQQHPTVGSGYLFRREWLRFYDPTKNPWGYKTMNRAILVDPANSQAKSSDYTYFWVIGAAEDHNYYVLDMLRDRFTLAERVDTLFHLHKKWDRPELVAYEEYGMQADISYIKEKQDRENHHFRILPVKGNLQKSNRIEQLEPLFKQGRIFLPGERQGATAYTGATFYVNKDGVREDMVKAFIEEEYADYVAGGGGVKHDDGLDALARLFDIPLAFPVTSQINAAYRIFDIVHERNTQGRSGWGA